MSFKNLTDKECVEINGGAVTQIVIGVITLILGAGYYAQDKSEKNASLCGSIDAMNDVYRPKHRRTGGGSF